jgi:hypothetical protein
VIVADLGFVDTRHAITSPARRLLDLARAAGAPTISVHDLVVPCASAGTTWYRSWDDAVTRLEVGTASTIDVSVPGDPFAGPWLTKVASHGSDRGKSVVVRAPASVAVTIEDSAAELRLRTLGTTPFVFLDDDTLITGGSQADRPAIRLESAAVVAAVRRLATPTS